MEKNSRKLKDRVKLYFKGLAMGAADIVPGVSGGTVAFVTGIYDDLLKSLSSLDLDLLKLIFKAKFTEAYQRLNGPFLLPLILGVFSAIILLSNLMHYVLKFYPEKTWGFFFGLIIASIVYIFKDLAPKLNVHNAFIFVFGLICGFAFASLVPAHTEHTYLATYLSGAVSICAMILPGISGSFILLMLGKYSFITGALKSIFSGTHLDHILIFCLGCLSGLIIFSKALSSLLRKHKTFTILFLLGLMTGSLKKIWPWKEVTDSITIRGKVHVLSESNILPEITLDNMIVILIALSAFCTFFAIEKMGKVKENSRHNDK